MEHRHRPVVQTTANAAHHLTELARKVVTRHETKDTGGYVKGVDLTKTPEGLKALHDMMDGLNPRT